VKFQNKKLIIFDLDGTLIDSVPDLALSLNAMLESLGREHFSEDTIHSWLGNGAQTLVQRALLGKIEVNESIDSELFEKALRSFLTFYEQNVCVKTVLYRDVLDTLVCLKAHGYKMAIVTNKPEAFVAPILNTLGIYSFFEYFIGGDSLSVKKPDAEPLLHVCKELGITIKESIMVGDSKNDILAAKAAKMDSIGVSYGYNYGEDISEFSPDEVIADFKAMTYCLIGE